MKQTIQQQQQTNRKNRQKLNREKKTVKKATANKKNRVTAYGETTEREQIEQSSNAKSVDYFKSVTKST